VFSASIHERHATACIADGAVEQRRMAARRGFIRTPRCAAGAFDETPRRIRTWREPCEARSPDAAAHKIRHRQRNARRLCGFYRFDDKSAAMVFMGRKSRFGRSGKGMKSKCL
jgi:hypothetical protein